MRPVGTRERIVALLAALAAVLVAWGFHRFLEASRRGPFVLTYFGMDYPNWTDVVFNRYYLRFSLLAIALLAFALARSPLPAWMASAWSRLTARPGAVLAVLAVAAFAVILALRAGVLAGTATTQDEYTYDFIADTLEAGRLSNPPPEEHRFFGNEFVILDERGWYGKYPIGHPLLLALGGLVGARALVVPLLSVALLLVTYRLGRRIFADSGPSVALLAAFLLAISPQFLLTGATLLSQPASALFATLGLLALVALEDRPRLAVALAAGACFGYAILVRPLPGVLYVPVVGLYLLLRFRGVPWPRRLVLWSGVALPVLLGALGLLAVNYVQSGDPLTSGYHVDYGSPTALSVIGGGHSWDRIRASLISGGLVRTNLWQAGFPFLMLFALFARRAPRTFLLWGMIAAQLSYRVLVPKAGVMCTGPVYMYELLPWLALLTADGLHRAAASPLAEKLRGGRPMLRPMLAAGVAVAVLAFWPVHLVSLHAGAIEHNAGYRLVEQRGLHDAVVFYEERILGTWARYLRNPRLDLSDDVLFLRRTDFTHTELEAFMARRFPERTGWVLLYDRGRDPRLLPLEVVAARERERLRERERGAAAPSPPVEIPAQPGGAAAAEPDQPAASAGVSTRARNPSSAWPTSSGRSIIGQWPVPGTRTAGRSATSSWRL